MPRRACAAILAKLLDASGSATPALTASARRKAGAGLPALVAELEAALIPVNRAAGRRALARLAREVKRVTLGVGRNASVPPPCAASDGATLVPEGLARGRDERARCAAGAARKRRELLRRGTHGQAHEPARGSRGADERAGARGLNMPAGVPERRSRSLPSLGLTPPPLPGAPVRACALAAAAVVAGSGSGTPPAPPAAPAAGPPARLPCPFARGWSSAGTSAAHRRSAAPAAGARRCTGEPARRRTAAAR